jgi:sugar phosphate permease
MTWMPAYLVERGKLSMNRMGLLMLIGFGGLTLTSMLCGALADRLIGAGRDPIAVRKRFAMAGLLLGSVEIWGVVAPSETYAIFVAAFALIGLGAATSNCWALTQTAVPGEMIGRIIGIQNFIANLAGILAPLLTGWLNQRTSGYEASLWMIWIVLLTGVASYGFLVTSKNMHRRFFD